MAYTIKYTDPTKLAEAIEVEDNTLNTDTSLGIPGKNLSSYGNVIGENFLHLLENFANSSAPSNPVEGQLWYDNNKKQLLVWDSTTWVASGGLKKDVTEPEASSSTIGDLWVNTDTQQLYLFTGSTWILVGPEFSDGLSTGAVARTYTGTDNQEYTVLVLEIKAKPAIIIATNEFTPKPVINGYSTIKPGINISTLDITGQGVLTVIGVAESAKNLEVGTATVAASNFLRGDIVSTTSKLFRVRNNQGLQVGTSDNLNLSIDGNDAVISNNIAGAAIDLRVNESGNLATAVKIASNRNVGIQTIAPDYPLDVNGIIHNNDTILSTSTANSTSTITGAIQTTGGIGVAKNIFVGENLTVNGTTTLTGNIEPASNSFNIGSPTNKVNHVYSDTFTGETFIGRFQGPLTGNVNGKATRLASSTTFKIDGDVSSQEIAFDGATGSSTKTFNTVIDPTFITNKDFPDENLLLPDDEFLINRPYNNTGMLKVSKASLLNSVPQLPVGTIMPYVGDTAPNARTYGGYWLLCDGSTYTEQDYPELYAICLQKFNPALVAGQFAVPDFRGRLPLGRDNMGGTSADRVTNNAADTTGFFGGNETTTLSQNQMPDHKHDFIDDNTNKSYYVTRQTAETPPSGTTSWSIPNGAQTSALPTTGGVLNYGANQSAIDLMNPFLTINYIIWTGKEV